MRGRVSRSARHTETGRGAGLRIAANGARNNHDRATVNVLVPQAMSRSGSACCEHQPNQTNQTASEPSRATRTARGGRSTVL